MGFDVARVRGLFPALGDGWVHLDAQAGMQIPESVATTVSTAMRAPVSGSRGLFPSSQRGAAIVDSARRAAADVVGGDPAGVVLGPGRSDLLARLAGALAPRLSLGTEVVLSRLDDAANVAPWVRVAARSGALVRWAEMDIETCELPDWQFDEIIGEPTRVVAVTAASSAVGTRPDIALVAERAHAVGALVVVDATSAAASLPLDLHAMGADVVALCASSWGGPPVGALAFRDPGLLERLPACSLVAGARGPERLEMGRHAHPMLAGLVASVEYLAGSMTPPAAAVGTGSSATRCVGSPWSGSPWAGRCRWARRTTRRSPRSTTSCGRSPRSAERVPMLATQPRRGRPQGRRARLGS